MARGRNWREGLPPGASARSSLGVGAFASLLFSVSLTAAAAPPEGPRPPPEGPRAPPEGPSSSQPDAGPGNTRGPERAPGGRDPNAPVPPPPDVGNAAIDFEGGRLPEELGLIREADRRLRYVDPGGRFVATIHEDGSVTFADPWRREDRMRPDRGRAGGPTNPVAGVNPLQGMGIPGPNEWAALAMGLDPSRTAKSKLLERTHDLRVALAVAWTRDRIDERLRSLDVELLAIWTEHTLSRAERRRRIFERWDECDERFPAAGPRVPADARSAIDAYRVRAAEEAREKVIRFVRRFLPRGSRHAYTGAELDTFNRDRVSRLPFDPY